MYESHYGFTSLPFRMAPDPRFIYFSKHHRSALAHLEYALVHDVAFCLVTGEVGSGKTTLLRHVQRQLPPNMTLGLMSDTSRDIDDLQEWVNLAFDLPMNGGSRAVQRKQFKDFLVQQRRAGRRTLLIVDEAQNLGRRNLEELRLLSNINEGDEVLLQVILVGQPELQLIIADDRLRQVAQRISVQFHLGPLDAEETGDYIRHRLVTAGGSSDIFTPNATRRVYLHSAGVPRLINRLCDHSLAYGFGNGEKRISNAMVAAVADEMQRNARKTEV